MVDAPDDERIVRGQPPIVFSLLLVGMRTETDRRIMRVSTMSVCIPIMAVFLYAD